MKAKNFGNSPNTRGSDTYSGHKNIKWLWHSIWYKQENIYHLCFIGFMFLAFALLFAFACLVSFHYYQWILTNKIGVWGYITGMGSMFVFIVASWCKMQQRRWRKNRIRDYDKFKKAKVDIK
jgi:hypothetical protein